MNAAKLEKSDRLIRVDRLLSDGNAHSTMNVIIEANVCAVNSIIAELRQNGRDIICTRKDGVYYYRMED